jgi:cytochrome c oxidase subunit 2
MIYFVIRYSRKRNPRPRNIDSNAILETTWIVIPTFLVLAMFYYGWSGFKVMRNVPENAMEIKAVSRMWSWQFSYANGKKSSEMKVPAGKPVKVVITSEDVLHSLYIPAFRIKEAAVPGKENYLWFLPEEEGEFDLFCSEYCGTGHSIMVSKVVVMTPDAFFSWMNTDEQNGETVASGSLTGQSLIKEKGCLNCHSTDSTRIVGPSFQGIFRRKAIVISSGKEREVTVDEAYLKDSILHPGIDVVKGYPDIMPPQGDNLTEDELQAIIQYLRELR